MNRFFLLLLLILIDQVSIAQDTLVLISGRKIVVSSIDIQESKIAYRMVGKEKKLKKMQPMRVFSIVYRDGTEKIIYQPDSLDPLEFKTEEMRTFIKGEIDARTLYKNNSIKAAGLAVGFVSPLLGFYGLIGPPIYATVIGSFSPNVEKKLTFKISGDAAETAGIPLGNYFNEVSGATSAPALKKGQVLKIGNSSVKFKNDTDLNEAVGLINSKFNCLRIHAANEDDKLKLYKTTSSSILKESPYQEGFSKTIRDYKIRNGMFYGLIGLVLGAITYTAVENN